MGQHPAGFVGMLRRFTASLPVHLMALCAMHPRLLASVPWRCLRVSLLRRGEPRGLPRSRSRKPHDIGAAKPRQVQILMRQGDLGLSWHDCSVCQRFGRLLRTGWSHSQLIHRAVLYLSLAPLWEIKLVDGKLLQLSILHGNEAVTRVVLDRL